MNKKKYICIIFINVFLISFFVFVVTLCRYNRPSEKEYSFTYIQNAKEKMSLEIPEEGIDYVPALRKEVIFYYSEGTPDKEKIIDITLEYLVCLVDTEETSFCLKEEQKNIYQNYIEGAVERNAFMKDAVEAAGLNYRELIESRCFMMLISYQKDCHIAKVLDGLHYFKEQSSDSEELETITEEYQKILDKEKTELHKYLNNKYGFDLKVEELMREFFGDDYTSKTFSPWFRDAVANQKPPVFD